VDLNHRPRPYQASTVRLYNNLQDRGDCQTPRKSLKVEQHTAFCGLVVGWEDYQNLPRRCLYQAAFIFKVNLGVMRLTALTVQIAGPARTDRDIRFTIKVAA
jgi:hypothetical protein